MRMRRYSPLGILSLIAGALLEVDDLGGAMRSMGMFMLTVILGLGLHQFVVLPLVLVALTRGNPLKLVLRILDAMMAGMAPPSR